MMILKNGFKETELGFIPDEWKVVPLDKIITVHDKKRIPLSSKQRANMSGKYPYCGANGIIDFIDDYIFDGEFVLLAEDGGYWGQYDNSAYVMDGKFWVNNHAHIIQAISGVSDNYFLMYMLNFLDISLYISGTTRGKLNQGVMRQIPIPQPPLPEQRTIAHVLNTVRRAIDATERVIAAARELKRSMMKHLFTYGPVPVQEADQVKLKETEIGEVPVEWEVKIIANIADVSYGKGNPKSKGSIPVVGSGGIFDWTDIPLVNHPTIIVGRKGTAGRAWLMKGPSFPSDTTFYLQWKTDVDIDFIFNQFSIRTLSGEHSKTTIPSLTRPDLESFKVVFPSLPTQKTIKNKILTIEKKIITETHKKLALESLFNSLLHHLMTGKVRVNSLIPGPSPSQGEGSQSLSPWGEVR